MARMAGNILRNVLSRPATRRYPTVEREPYPGARGSLLFVAERCEFCGECERVCPSNAVILDTVWEKNGTRTEATWVRIYKPMLCILCNRCVEACTYHAIIPQERYLPPCSIKEDELGRVESW